MVPWVFLVVDEVLEVFLVILELLCVGLVVISEVLDIVGCF